MLGSYHEEKAKNEFCAKETLLYSPISHKSKAYFVVFIFSNDFELHA